MSAAVHGPGPILWVPGGMRVSPATPLLGLPIARRVALAARKAGFARTVFEETEDAAGLREALAGTGAELVSPGAPAPTGSVHLPPGTLPQASWLSARIGVPSDVAAMPDAGFFRILQPSDLAAAEKWLLQGLIKDSEGFMSRHVERRISLAISRRLATTSVTPNAMTLISIGVGLAGAALFLSARTPVQFAGALLFLLHSILDGCDGEIARLKFLESRLGGILDFWGDNVVHCAVFGCLAVGWSRAGGDTWPLVAGLAAITGTLLSAGLVYRQTMLESKAGPQFTSVTSRPSTRMSRAADALARRDFIYLVVLLAAFGKAYWFLVLAAIGAPLFFFALVAIEISGRRVGRSFS